VAVALVFTTTFITTPLSAADFGKTALGSVSAVGNVQLRGISISQEGTLFAGDSIRAADKAYAKVLLKKGSKIEVGEKTEITVGSEAIAMVAGNLGFTSGKDALRIAFHPFEILASDATGNVSVNKGTAAGVRAINGKLTVRNTKTSESFVLTKGQERWFGLKDGSSPKPLAELASNLPDTLPPMPQTPAGQSGGGMDMDAGAWAAVIAAGAITGIAIWALVVALDNQDDIDALQDDLDDLQGTVSANQAAANAAIAALQRAQQMSDAAFNARINALAIASTAQATQAIVAAAPNLSASQRSAFTTRATTLASQATATSATIASIEAQINALETQIAASGTVTAAQLAQLDTLRNQLNTAIGQLNTIRNMETQLLADLQSAGVTPPTQSSQPSPTASASIPS
jgi:hypothetical protein